MKFANRVEVDQTALRLTEVLYAAVCSCGLNPSQHMQFGDALLHINCRRLLLPSNRMMPSASINQKNVLITY